MEYRTGLVTRDEKAIVMLSPPPKDDLSNDELTDLIRSSLKANVEALQQLLIEGEESGDAEYSLDSIIDELDHETSSKF
ncbi:type II toxin-antitoxin system ParD family antitoxin [Endozoicomonas arenosclerae]|uniref:type II toxin-antitoxin system ParD family antitoxin n=1 Tax=Endozoicomonas arenosclerae TaxID=1633495 RepID=UPI001C12B45D|nr:type II toxin-antitoxin system ParD family antitoxin [Endozoicomonas arenosclerae]